MLQIPESLYQGFITLFELPEKEIEDIFRKIDSFPIGTPIEKISNKLHTVLSESKSSIVVKTVFSFGQLLNDEEKSLHEIAQELAQSVIEIEEFHNHNINDYVKILSRLVFLLELSGGVKRIYKFTSLQLENSNTFYESKIVTDIRMLEDEENKAFIIHNLKIEYGGSNESKIIYVSLNAKDLKTLQAQIDKSLTYEEKLKDKFKEISFINID